ncbi:FUSC family protein [Paraburkholderia bryophila]|uniref:Multidrug resistance protein MdtO n=1 Tax=Paraburkholderia bryophila TaxID=420952 RepID=A0A7Y9W8C1_9BURK|nr:FUSC family protein [Paraburkholderia bryophila]NYH16094.1 multidrug resistance protein MdtO [Paraburkholderia bryophila]
MAQPAGELARPGAADILKLLAPYPGRAAMATRIALICALTVFVTSAYGTPEAALSAYIVFFLNRPDRVTSVLLSAALMVLVTLVIGLVLGVAIFALDDPLWRVACIAGLSFGLLFVTSASKLRPVGAILAMIVGFGLDKLGSVPFGEVATRALLYTWLFVAIPVGVSICVNMLLAPSPRRLAGRELAKRLRAAARGLNEPDDAARAALTASLRDGDAQLGTWLKLSVVDGSSARADIPALRQAVSSTLAILVAADLAAREPSARLPATFAAPLAETLENMARMFDAGGYPVEIELALPGSTELPPLARMVADNLRAAITGFAVVEAVQEGDTATSATASASAPAPASAPATPAAKPGGFFLPDAFTNPDHVRYALKTTVAALFCYLLYSQIDWPGIHTCFITVYIVSLGTTAETVEKLTLRIAGCLVGAFVGTAAIVFVTPALTSIVGLMALVMVGAWLAAWVAFGSPRIGYAGFQIAFAFFLCVVQGAAPAFDLTVARDRTIGILLGNVVVYLVFTRVWPVSVATRVDVALAALQQQWQRLTSLAQSGARRTQAASAMAQYGALQQDLALMHYEPSWVRPEPEWIAERRDVLAGFGALEGPMFLLAEQRPGDVAIDSWLRRITREMPQSHAEVASSEAAVAHPTPPEPTPDDTRAALLKLGEARLTQLEHAASDDAAKGLATHAPV